MQHLRSNNFKKTRDRMKKLCALLRIKFFAFCTILLYSDKRKQLLKVTFFVNEQNVSVMYVDFNAISLCLELNIF